MKLPQISGKELIKKLCRLGFVITRQKGSHIRLEKNTQDKTIKLTIPNHKIIELHLRDILIFSEHLAFSKFNIFFRY